MGITPVAPVLAMHVDVFWLTLELLKSPDSWSAESLCFTS